MGLLRIFLSFFWGGAPYEERSRCSNIRPGEFQNSKNPNFQTSKKTKIQSSKNPKIQSFHKIQSSKKTKKQSFLIDKFQKIKSKNPKNQTLEGLTFSALQLCPPAWLALAPALLPSCDSQPCFPVGCPPITADVSSLNDQTKLCQSNKSARVVVIFVLGNSKIPKNQTSKLPKNQKSKVPKIQKSKVFTKSKVPKKQKNKVS